MNYSKILVITPTLNEACNILDHINLVVSKGLNILIVDDNSSDGTSEIVKKHTNYLDNLFLIKRLEDAGLGKSYIAGFNWAVKNSFEYVVEMDADFSHRIDDLMKMLDAKNDYDVVIGSRYINEGKIIGWSAKRKILSYVANLFSRMVSKSNVKDMTSGFRIYKVDSLKYIQYDKSTCSGYSFQIDMTIRSERSKLNILEFPITFEERKEGTSKMNFSIVLEAIKYLFKVLFNKI